MAHDDLSSIITIATKILHFFLLIVWVDITFHYIVDIRNISNHIVERLVTTNTIQSLLSFGYI
jgi:hypothetical protein